MNLDNKKFRKKEEAEKLIENFPDKLPIEMNRRKKTKVLPPLTNLLDIQKNANNKWGYKAEETLNTVQSLYEKHKAVSYPRTDCNFVTENTALKLDKKLSNFEKFEKYPFLDFKNLNKKNIGEVSAHEAITPTGVIY